MEHTAETAHDGQVAGVPGFTHRGLLVEPETWIHYVVGGRGPLVVLLHGYPYSWLEWRGVARPLADHGFTVLIPDLRGIGRSRAPAGRHTKRRDAADIRAILDDLSIDSATVVGTDIGAMVAHAYAALYPGHVTALVLSEAGLPGFGLEEHMNVATGGPWHFGLHLNVDVAEALTEGRERQYLEHFWSMSTGGVPLRYGRS